MNKMPAYELITENRFFADFIAQARRLPFPSPLHKSVYNGFQ